MWADRASRPDGLNPKVLKDAANVMLMLMLKVLKDAAKLNHSWGGIMAQR